jgi:urease accessory protein
MVARPHRCSKLAGLREENAMRMRRMHGVAGWMAMTAGMVASGPAAAHHMMGNQLPGTFMQGLLSGLGHPVIGLDHLVAIVTVGALASLHRRGALLAAGFVLVVLAGAVLQAGGVSLPHGEALVAVTLIALGALLVLGRAPLAAVVAVAAGAGLLHGYMMGESIVGAERTPLVAYFVGLAVIQSAVAYCAMLAARALSRQMGTRSLRLAGTAVIMVGAIFLTVATLSA